MNGAIFFSLMSFAFSFHFDNKRIFIRRERGTRINPAFVQDNVRFGGGGGGNGLSLYLH